MKKKSNIYDDFAKVKLCIESCNTKDQLKVMFRMLELFCDKHSDNDVRNTLDDMLYINLTDKLIKLS